MPDITAEGVRAVACKLDAMRALGATVLLSGRDFDDGKGAARRHADLSGAIHIEDGAHGEIAHGAGTLALELTEAEDRVDAIFVRWAMARSPPESGARTGVAFLN